MKILEYFSHYPDEASCKEEFKLYRESQGVVCKKCSSKDTYWWLESKQQYECKKCGFRMSLKSGTVMENSKLPYQYWFIAMHLMTSTKKTISALELQRQLGHKYYEPIWTMMHKIRLVMGKRDDVYRLSGGIEADESYYSTRYSDQENEFTNQKEELKRGKGSQRKTAVLVMASCLKMSQSELMKQKRDLQTKPKFIKMKVVEDGTAQELKKTSEANIIKDANFKTDKAKSYRKAFENFNHLEMYDMSMFDSEKILPWISKAITNCKNILKAMHHGIEKKYLQNYLNEFCYKYNRRYFGEKLFNRLLVCAVGFVWY
jgi:DNA-directed RNA polymerase subunit RPC12/RpoP